MLVQRRHWLAAISILALGAGARPAAADTPDAASSCPSVSAVAEQLSGLGAAPGTRAPVIVDGGSWFTVTITAETKRFEDRARRCAERARQAAVYIAMTLSSAHEVEPKPEAARAPLPLATPAPPATQAATPVEHRRTAELVIEGAAALDVPLAAGGTDTISGGGGLRVAGGRRWRRLFLGASIGVSGQSTMTMRFETGASALVDRVPFDASLRAGVQLGRAEVGLDAGFSAAVLVIRGRGALAMTQTATRADVGLRLATFGRWWVNNRVAPTLTMDATVTPEPWPIALEPVRVVGHLPAAWLAIYAGVSVKLY